MKPTETLPRSIDSLTQSIESLAIKSKDNLGSQIESEDCLRNKARLARFDLVRTFVERPAHFTSSLTKGIQNLDIKQENNLRESPWSLRELEKTKPRETIPNLNEFLSQIFEWDPTWLEEPDDFSPPVVNKSKLTSTLETYTSFGEYYEIVEPLVTLEIWHSILADYTEEKEKLKTFTVTSSPRGFDDLFEDEVKGKIDIKLKISHKDLVQELHPAKGDLLSIDYVSQRNTKLDSSRRKLFAYVTGMRKDIFDKTGRRCTKSSPESANNVLIRIKTLDLTDAEQHSITKIQKITYIRSNIRTVRALQKLHASPLRNMIFRPEIEDYQLPSVDNTEEYRLVTEDNLNPRQKEAVMRVTETVAKGIPKICLIQGPPGTGKSKVVVNLVMQILADDSQTSRETKILICAPSNPAVDEIVLRLLELEEFSETETGSKLSLVRVGRTDAMHPDVRSVGLERRSERSRSTNLLTLMRSRNYRELESASLLGANVIASTLNSSFAHQMELAFRPDRNEQFVCIIDEASQCTEPESFIPLMLNVTTLVLVGDPKQLPATVLSQEANKLGLGQSLFARIDKLFEGQSKNPKIQLDVQYRMSIPVARFPNDYFYGGTLKNAAKNLDLPFYRYRVINLDSVQDREKFFNPNEASFVMNLVHTIILARAGSGDSISPLTVGIITPYKDQKKIFISRIREFKKNLKTPNEVEFEVNTVDSYQGQERDIIIMSCVRSRGIGFLSDPHRLCVALTRAKHSLFICGNFETFKNNCMWNSLLNDAKSRGVYVNAKSNAGTRDIGRLINR